ncbi:hypothetical protein GCM10010103_32430 [Streptomyces paradoxus]|uniref:Crotonobetainyl-CoA:carnitine CoA-transferase CaiB-like acyl-CoA transferase n=1 Tax=Streptomyces paradoxus TaxID=66375 RepID=A0A7W9WH51_9ACTN|nr:crotonobetainyl-CoA:carnitine CoA-transferase CaiB-like acyl-CoA transferase [Streptomyces paradoxus]
MSGVVSDRLGRKPVLLPALALALAACAIFATATTVVALIVARLFTGIAVGAVVSAGMAAVTDVAGTAAGRPDLAEDPRVSGDAIDSTDHEDLAALLETCAAALTTEEWAEVCAKHSIPMAPVLELDRAHDDPYVRDGHLLDTAEHPTEGTVRTIGIPLRFSATPGSIRRLAPVAGQDTEDVLAELDAAR